MGKSRYKEVIVQDLDLAPIMNLCMILIPLLLLSAVFVNKGIIDVNVPSVGAAPAANTEPSEEILPPQLVLLISSNGFYLKNQNGNPTTDAMFAQFAAPLPGCPSVAPGAGDQAPTICLSGDVGADRPLIERLNWAGLYNRLVEIRLQPQWFPKYNEEGAAQIIITADASVEFAVITKAMDTARYFLRPPNAELAAPAEGADASQYQLGAGGVATNQNLTEAKFILGEGETPVGLFQFAAIGAPSARN
jgi:biopolymer transport protein ExbD